MPAKGPAFSIASSIRFKPKTSYFLLSETIIISVTTGFKASILCCIKYFPLQVKKPLSVTIRLLFPPERIMPVMFFLSTIMQKIILDRQWQEQKTIYTLTSDCLFFYCHNNRQARHQLMRQRLIQMFQFLNARHYLVVRRVLQPSLPK